MATRYKGAELKYTAYFVDMFASCLSPSGIPILWLCPLLRSTMPRIGAMWARSTACTLPSMTVWLCSFFRSPCNNISCKGLSHGFLRTPAWKDPHAVAPFVPRQSVLYCHFMLFEKLRPDRFFERFAWEPRIQAVGVHLDDLILLSIDGTVETIVIKLRMRILASWYTTMPTWNGLLIVTFSFWNSISKTSPISSCNRDGYHESITRFALSTTCWSLVYIILVCLSFASSSFPGALFPNSLNTRRALSGSSSPLCQFSVISSTNHVKILHRRCLETILEIPCQ